MNYQAIEKIKFKTPEGLREIKAGSILTLDAEKAAMLLELKKIRPIELPENCRGCWAEWRGNCYAKVKGLSCIYAVTECQYTTKH